MRRAATESPFADHRLQEAAPQWILWQKPEASEAERPLPVQSEASAACATSTAPQPAARPVIHHSQYDAIVKRMQQATKQTGAYSDWS